MKIWHKLLVLAAALGISGAIATPAQAQATRTWVSGVGDDVNPCSRTAPCKTFAGAISKTATNGEINCLDPAGYGAVNITKSIIIACGWTQGGILAANTNGIIVNCAACHVTLRGLNINGAGTTTGNGIRIINAGSVNIDRVVMEGHLGTTTNGRGVVIEATAANTRVTIQNTDISNMGFVGIHVTPGVAGSVILNVDNVRITRTGFSSIQLQRSVTATINNSSLTHSGAAGLTTEQSTVTAHVSNSYIANNVHGVFNGSGGNPTTRLYGTVITANTTNGLTINSGSVLSYGNNAIRGNTGNEAPTGAVLGTQ